MKATKLIILLVLCSLLTDICIAQWQPEVILTSQGGATSLPGNNARCIVSSGDWLHLIWRVSANSFSQVFYKHSTDGGISWGKDTQLTNSNWYVIARPTISVSGEVAHVVWMDSRAVNYKLFYKRSTDAGISWSPDKELTFDFAFSESPAVFASGQLVHLTWHDSRDGNNEIYYKRSTDEGISWGADTRLTNNPASSRYPSISVFGQVIHIVWEDTYNGNVQIYYKRSTDEGISWSPDIQITTIPDLSRYPCITSSGDFVCFVWESYRDGNEEIYCKRSTDGGSSWSPDIRLTNNSAYSRYPAISISGELLHVVWLDHRDGYDEVYYKNSTDDGINWGTDTRLSAKQNSVTPFISVFGQAVHVVFAYGYFGGLYYRRNPTGNVLGVSIISSEVPREFSLYQNYPNPFNPMTIVKFQMPNEEFVKLIVFDMLGREIATLVNENLKAGTYEVNWDGTNYPSGMYFYKLMSGEYAESKK